MTTVAQIALVAISSLIIARSAAAQQRGTVADSAGAPVVGALVEVWAPNRRLASTTTDERGAYVVSAEQLGDASGLLIRRIGFRPLRAAWHGDAPSTAFVLTRLPVALREVKVTAAARRCPQRDEPEAHALWLQVARTYTGGAPWSFGARMASVMSTVDGIDALGPIAPESRRDGSWTTRNTGMYAARVEHGGYAWALPSGHILEDFGAWEYPPLDATFAWHFSTPQFAARHTMRRARSDGGGIALTICPADPRAGGLEGELVIAADTSAFIGAQWVIRGQELAGGDVSFAPRPALGTPPLLLAAAGHFWRRLPSGRYYVRTREFEAWVVRDGSVYPTPDSIGLPPSSRQ